MKALDLTNQTFGELTAIKSSVQGKKRGWDCLCSCGNSVWIPTFQLTSGNNKTCGDGLHKQSIKVGDRFGQLVIKSIYRDSINRRYMAECICDCGGIKSNASFKNLQRGATTHCGCSTSNINRGKPEGVSILNALISSYINNAKKKDLPFTLSKDECEQLFQGNCYLCGQEPSSVFTKKNIKGAYTYSSIDRIDSTKGYTWDNVASCCSTCNYLKSNKTNAEFLNHVFKISAYQKLVNLREPNT